MSDADITYHLVARPYWDAQPIHQPYQPEAFAADGFIHCTDGVANVIDVGNRYYRDDAREFVVLVIEKARIAGEWRYDDDARIYPHIYGALNRDAIVDEVALVRSGEGEFVSVGAPRPGARRS